MEKTEENLKKELIKNEEVVKKLKFVKKTLKLTIFIIIVFFGLLVAMSQDPTINWLFKLIGLFAWVYGFGRLLFPKSKSYFNPFEL